MRMEGFWLTIVFIITGYGLWIWEFSQEGALTVVISLLFFYLSKVCRCLRENKEIQLKVLTHLQKLT